MNWFEQILQALDGKMTRPTMYGWFHLMFIGIMVALSVGLGFLAAKKRNEKTFKIVIWVCWAVMFLLEVYKQLNYSFNYEGGSTYWDYQWYAFPYQLCSTPLYVLPIIGCLKEGKVRDALMSFISTFTFFGGLITFIYPGAVFISTIGINIQTMVHHGLQIVLGIFCMIYNKDKLNFKYYFKAVYVFLIAIAVALILNMTIPLATDETFNMFYVSPKFPCSLVVLDKIYAAVPYIVFLLIYIIGFCLAALIIHLVYMLCTGKFKKKKAKTKS